MVRRTAKGGLHYSDGTVSYNVKKNRTRENQDNKSECHGTTPSKGPTTYARQHAESRSLLAPAFNQAGVWRIRASAVEDLGVILHRKGSGAL